MATDPAFAATVNNNAVLTSSTADTSTTAPSTTVTVFTAGSSGSKVEQIRITQVVTTAAAGVINIFLYDGSTYHLWESLAYGTGTVSTTAAVAVTDYTYNNLVLKSGWTIRATNTVASNSGATSAATHKVHAMGADF